MKLIRASDGTEHIFTAQATDDSHVKLHVVGSLRAEHPSPLSLDGTVTDSNDLSI